MLKHRSIQALACLLAFAALSASAQDFTITTFAGAKSGAGSTDGTGPSASFTNPYGIALNPVSGNFVITDTDGNTIRVMTPSGGVTTLAGKAGISGSANGTGSQASFFSPSGVAVDVQGNAYVADRNNHLIRKITPTGIVTTFAGQAGVSGQADGVGALAQFKRPVGMSIDSAGNLYVADTDNHAIRKIAPDGTVTTLAGQKNVPGSSDGTGSAAHFKNPEGLAVDSSNGSVYVADTKNHTIRMVTSGGTVTTIAGLANVSGNANGTGSAARFNNPAGVTLKSTGVVYVLDQNNNLIRQVTSPGVATIAAGTLNSPGCVDGAAINTAKFKALSSASTDAGGNLFITDTFNNAIRKLTTGGQVSTVAGSAGQTGVVDGQGIAARFGGELLNVAIDNGGNIFVADYYGNVIRKITPSGAVTLYAGQAGQSGHQDGPNLSALFSAPKGICVANNGDLFVTEDGNSDIRKISSGGTVSTLAGNPGTPGYQNGFGQNALFDSPRGIAIDPSQNFLYVCDFNNNVIRSVSTGMGLASLFAGQPNVSGGLDGNATSGAQFAGPSGIATNGSTVYIVDELNHNVRVILSNTVSTLAGDAGFVAGNTDGNGASGRFDTPRGCALDNSGNLLVAAAGSLTIRLVTPSGDVSTPAGVAYLPGSTDGTGSNARFAHPQSICANPSGKIFIGDATSIREAHLTLTDTAMIDQATAPAGQQRSFSVLNPTAGTTYGWRAIRRPGNSAANISPSNSQTPVFTPDAADVFVFELTATDPTSGGVSISQVTLTATPQTPVISSSLNVTATTGTPFTYTIAATNFPTAFGALNLPAGFSFNPNTGLISGTFTTGGNKTIPISASNGAGSANTNLSVTVSQPPAISTANSFAFTIGNFGTFNVTASGFPIPSIAIGGVALPSGLSFLDLGNGNATLSGTPAAGTAGTYALTFTASNGAGSNAVQNFTLTVVAAPAAGPLDSSFNPNVTGGGGFVLATAVQPDNKIVIGGNFTSIGGATINRIARLNEDGSVDANFNSGSGTNSDVQCVAVQPDGKILIGGQFTSVNGQPFNRIARLNANGSVDAGFNIGTGANLEVDCLALQTDGKILISGLFTSVDGQPRNRIARLNTDGSVEDLATFDPGAGANNLVYSVAVQTNGKIVIGGQFSTFDLESFNGIVRLNADGSIEDTATFDPGTGANGPVFSVAVQTDGKILLGGQFNTFDGQSRSRIARLNGDGSLESVSTFNPGTGANGDIYSLALQTDGKILASGLFTSINGQTRNHIARLNPDGTVESTATFNAGSGTIADILCVAQQADGKILIGGNFSAVNGQTRNGLARLLNDGFSQTLTVPSAAQIQWLRSGACPEAVFASFELSTDSGATWSPLGFGARIAGGWQLTGLSLPATGSIRARGRTAGARDSGSSGLVEQVAPYSLSAGQPPVIVSLDSDQNPAFLNSTVNFDFTATDTDTTTLNYDIDFGDNSPHATGSFSAGTAISVSHIYSAYGDKTVRLTVSDGTTAVTKDILQSVPPPASSGLGVPNISDDKDPVVNPVDKVSVGVLNSNGGVVQLNVNVDALTAARINALFDVQTFFGDIAQRSSIVRGVQPVHQFIHRGIFVATSSVTRLTTNQFIGKARKTLVISSKETGEQAPNLRAAFPDSRALGDAPDSAIATKSLKGKFIFSTAKNDVVSYSGTIKLPQGLDTSKPHEFSVGIGNIVSDNMIDARGKGIPPAEPGIIKKLKVTYLKVKKGAITKGGELAKIDVQFNTSGMIAAGFDTEGIVRNAPDAAPGKKVQRTIQIALLLDGIPYEAQAPVDFAVSNNSEFGTIAGRR